MKNDAVELKLFINSTLDAIEKGADLKHRDVVGSVEFEVKLAKTKKGKAGLKIYVAALGGEASSVNIATVKFKVETRHKNNEVGVVNPKLP